MWGHIFVYVAPGRYSPEDKADMMAEYGIADMACDDIPRGVLTGTVDLWDCTGEGGQYEWHVCKPERAKKLQKPTGRPQPAWFDPF